MWPSRRLEQTGISATFLSPIKDSFHGLQAAALWDRLRVARGSQIGRGVKSCGCGGHHHPPVVDRPEQSSSFSGFKESFLVRRRKILSFFRLFTPFLVNLSEEGSE
jgi:hypothetical protein